MIQGIVDRGSSWIRGWVIACLVTVSVTASRVGAQTPIDTAALENDAVARATEYVRINTTDPPGNEAQAMRFFARIFQQEGIPFDTASSAPGRGNIWARLKGGDKPALVLLHHMDVVPADPRYWTADPFAATVGTERSMHVARSTPRHWASSSSRRFSRCIVHTSHSIVT